MNGQVDDCGEGWLCYLTAGRKHNWTVYLKYLKAEFLRSAIQLRNLVRYAGMASVKYISRMPEERRLAVLTAFISALDEAVDVLDMLILDITRSAKNIGQKKRLRPLKNLDRAALLLARVCTLLLDENTDEAALRQAIFRRIPKDKLAESFGKVNELARRCVEL